MNGETDQFDRAFGTCVGACDDGMHWRPHPDCPTHGHGSPWRERQLARWDESKVYTSADIPTPTEAATDYFGDETPPTECLTCDPTRDPKQTSEPLGVMGLTEIAEAWGISRQRVSQLTKRADFPAPAFRAKAGSFWLMSDVEEYDRQRQVRVERHYGRTNTEDAQ